MTAEVIILILTALVLLVASFVIGRLYQMHVINIVLDEMDIEGIVREEYDRIQKESGRRHYGHKT